MASDHWTGTFAGARDATGDHDVIEREDPNEVYNRRRCVTCGAPWDEHDKNSICERHRPLCPSWVDEALARHERAREMRGGDRVERSGALRAVEAEAAKDGGAPHA